MSQNDSIARFHTIHSMVTSSFDDPGVKAFLREKFFRVMEAVEFYEKQVGKNCKFFKAGLKQMAMDISGWEQSLYEEAVSILRSPDKAHISPTVVQEVHGKDIHGGGVNK